MKTQRLVRIYFRQRAFIQTCAIEGTTSVHESLYPVAYVFVKYFTVDVLSHAPVERVRCNIHPIALCSLPSFDCIFSPHPVSWGNCE